MPAGRPTALNDEVARTLLNALRLGNPFVTACQFAGIDDSTLRRWRQKGDEALRLSPGKRSPSQRKYAEFRTAIDKAIVEANVRAQQTIHTVMTQPLQNATSEEKRIIVDAAKFYLTHRDPSHYSTQQRTELTGKDGEAVEISAAEVWNVLQKARAVDADDT